MHRTDALSLALLQGFLASDEAVLPFLTQLHTTLDKAAIGLSPGLRVLKDSLANALREVGGTARDYSHAPLQTLLLARANSKTVEMLYSSRSSDTTRFRKVDPYRIDRRDGRYLEMQAWCHERKEVRTFALDRVQEVRILEETFSFREWKQSDDGIVGGIRGGSPVDVHVRFDRVVAPFAKDRRWPFAATLTEETDGSIVLKGTVLGTEGMVRELLSWRRHALVLGGKELLKAMQEEVAALSDLYSEQRVDTLQEKK
jgi:predicted DNA-binding transcriptional regulator YafY